MADYVIDSSNSVTTTDLENTPAQVLASGDTLLVTEDGSLATQATDQPAVLAADGNVTITVDGLVQGGQLHAINITAGGNTITVNATGQVLADPSEDGGYGIRLRGFNGGGNNTVVNNGTISGLVGISQAFTTGNLTVVNNWSIVGFPSDDAAAIAAQSGDNSVTNNGFLSGNVFLGIGNDTYDGALGAIDGKVLLNEGNDVAIGGAGNEVLHGGAGDDHLSGGGGNDTLFGGSGENFLFGGDGIDTAMFSDGSVWVDLDMAFAGDEVDVLIDIENVVTGAGDDFLFGDSKSNMLDGGAGDDFLVGAEGANLLIGGIGSDMVAYEDGIDGSIFDVIVDLTKSGEQETGRGLDTLVGIESVKSASGNDMLTGDGEANTLDAGAGDDMLTGGLGNDILTGWEGIDTAVFLGLDGAGEVVSIEVDLSQAGPQDTGEGLDTLSGIENVTSGTGADFLTGDDAANRLDAGAGDDALYGGGGADTLLGGDGNDFLSGGEGADTLEGGAGDDTLVAGGGANAIIGGEGVDLAVVSGNVSFASLSGIESLSGDDGDNEIELDQATFDGLSGLEGGDGTDTLFLAGGVFDFTQAGLFVTGFEALTLTADDTALVFDGLADFDKAVQIDALSVAGASVQFKTAILSEDQRKALYDRGFATVTHGAQYSPAPDTPIVAPVTVSEDGITPVVIVRNPQDGAEVTHYKIIGIANGTLYADPGLKQPIANGTFVASEGLTTTLYFKPDANFFGTATFAAQASLSASNAGLGGGTAAAAITVASVDDAPVGLALTGSTVAELSPTGADVGTLTASDADPGGTLTYSLIDDAGGRFALGGDKGDRLVVANGVALDFEQARAHLVTVRVSDGTGRFVDQAFTILVGNAGTEITAGTTGNDAVVAGGGRDTLGGGGGNDRLAGGANRDTLNGGLGNDRLDGDLGIDRLVGGAGRDVFVFDAKLGRSNVDLVKDFNVKDDSFQLDNAIFKKLGKGTPTKPLKLSADAFHKGKVAGDREDRILYDKGTGALSYDADGTGGAKAVKFAVLKKGLALTAADFFII